MGNELSKGPHGAGDFLTLVGMKAMTKVRPLFAWVSPSVSSSSSMMSGREISALTRDAQPHLLLRWSRRIEKGA